MKKQTEVLVIGGGGIGICSAYYLNKRGFQVTLIDKGEICSGSSYGNAGLIVPSHSLPLAAPGVAFKALKWMFDPESPFYIKPRLSLDLLLWLWKFQGACTKRHIWNAMPVIRDLSLASCQLFEDLAANENLNFGYQKKGMLQLFLTKKGLNEGVEEAELMQKIGLEVDILNPSQIPGLEPNIEIKTCGGIFYSQDAQIIPTQFVKKLAYHITKKGVDIRPSTEVIDFEISGLNIKTIKTTRGDFTAKHVILASGAWSSFLGKILHLNLPIQPAKGYSITVKRSSMHPTIPLNLMESKVAVTPMGNTLRFAGTLELAGLDFSINQRRVEAILSAVPQYLPSLDPKNLELIEVWRGFRPCTPDGLPFLGNSPNYKNLVVATGHGMIGISLSPITGMLVSQLVTGETPPIDLTLLSVNRFS